MLIDISEDNEQIDIVMRDPSGGIMIFDVAEYDGKIYIVIRDITNGKIDIVMRDITPRGASLPKLEVAL